MINKAECYTQAMHEVKTAGHIAVEQADALRQQLLIDHPELARLEKEMITLSQKKMQATIHSPDTLPALEHDYKALKNKQTEYFTAIGYTYNPFQPQYQCLQCQDTGMTQKGICACVKKRANEKMLEQLCDQFPIDDFSFDTFSLAYYDGEDLEQMKTIYQQCVSYASTFTKKSKSLYILGNTGLGKTHLTFSMAKEIVKKGYSVLYSTAQNMITALEKEHFGQAEQPIQEYYLTCDLLIIDDLGTEFLSNVAQSELYNVINHRILMDLPTIINTNLSPSELEKRYGERLVSRICGCYHALHFYGDDVRIKKRFASKNLKNIEKNT